MPRVRLIDVEGEQVGLKTRDEALEYAWGKNLDLVEVAPDANPPVCRVMDYSKYKYEQEQKQKLARKHQSTITIKEIKLRPKIDPHDYETKKGHVAAVPQEPRQGQGHDHVPRPGDVPPRARTIAAPSTGRRRQGPRA